MNYSTSVSSDITRQIIKKVEQIHSNRVKMAKLGQKAQEEVRKYPTQITTKLINFNGIKPSGLQKLPLQQFDSHPKSPVFCPNFQHTTSNFTPLLVPRSSNSIGRQNSKFRVSHQPSMNKGQCIKIQQKQQFDQEIENLRIKKQKLYDLQAYFLEAEKKQKMKPRIQKTKHAFTTDFDGQQLQLNPIKRRYNNDSYSRVELNVTLREEREDHHRISTEQSMASKQKNKTKHFPNKIVRPNSKVATSFISKQDCISRGSQNLPLRELQQQFKKTDMNSTFKSKKSRQGNPLEGMTMLQF